MPIIDNILFRTFTPYGLFCPRIPTTNLSDEWLRGIDVDKEYEKVMQKKSMLSSRQRQTIVWIHERKSKELGE